MSNCITNHPNCPEIPVSSKPHNYSINRTVKFYLIIQTSHRQCLDHFVGVNEMVSSTFALEKGD